MGDEIGIETLSADFCSGHEERSGRRSEWPPRLRCRSRQKSERSTEIFGRMSHWMQVSRGLDMSSNVTGRDVVEEGPLSLGRVYGTCLVHCRRNRHVLSRMPPLPY